MDPKRRLYPFKNITLGYTIPVFKKYINRLRVYVTGEDIWEHSNLLSIYDPEVGNTPGRDVYPSSVPGLSA